MLGKPLFARPRAFFLLLALVLALLGGCARRPPLRETRLVLGTSATITIYDDRVPRGIMERVFDRVVEIESLMSSNASNWPDSEVLTINRAAGRHPVAVSEDTFEVVERGIRYSSLTNGVFDISVGPLVSLWGVGTPRERVPTMDEILAAIPLIDFSRVEIDPEQRTVFLPDEGMAIDVGGIAKGFAVQEAAELLRSEGVTRAVLDFGGDVYTVGRRPDNNLWRIGLQSPEAGRGGIIAVIESSNTSVVTSGAYERFFIQDGVRYHHMIDISTGFPARSEVVSVTAIAENATLSDVLSTAGFILGLQEGIELFMRIPDVEGIFVTEDRRVFVTDGLGERFRLTDPEFRLASIESVLGR